MVHHEAPMISRRSAATGTEAVLLGDHRLLFNQRDPIGAAQVLVSLPRLHLGLLVVLLVILAPIMRLRVALLGFTVAH